MIWPPLCPANRLMQPRFMLHYLRACRHISKDSWFSMSCWFSMLKLQNVKKIALFVQSSQNKRLTPLLSAYLSAHCLGYSSNSSHKKYQTTLFIWWLILHGKNIIFLYIGWVKKISKNKGLKHYVWTDFLYDSPMSSESPGCFKKIVSPNNQFRN